MLLEAILGAVITYLLLIILDRLLALKAQLDSRGQMGPVEHYIEDLRPLQINIAVYIVLLIVSVTIGVVVYDF
jgi:hypothetical protein